MSIEEIYLPTLEELKGKEVFAWGSFKKITFGPNLTSVPGGDTFAYSDSIKELVFEGGVPTFGSSAFNRISTSAKLIFLGEVEEFAINSTKKAFSVYFINTSLDDISFKNDSYTTTYIKAYSCVDNKAIKFGTDGTVSDIEFVHLYEKTVSTDPTCVMPAMDSQLCYCGHLMAVEKGAPALGHDNGVEAPVVVAWNYNGNYYADAKFVHICTVCDEKYDGETNVGSALFTKSGFSANEDNMTDVVFIVYINDKNIKEYITENNVELMYGLVVSANTTGTPLSYANGKVESSANTVKIDMTGSSYNKLTMRVTNVGELSLHCAGYVSLNGEISYLNHGTVDKTATTVSLSVIDSILNPVTPPPADENTEVEA